MGEIGESENQDESDMKGRMRKCSINDKDNDNGLSERKVYFLEPKFL